MTGVNTLYQSLVNHPDLPGVDFSHLKLVSAGGMAVLEATAKRWAEIMARRSTKATGSRKPRR